MSGSDAKRAAGVPLRPRLRPVESVVVPDDRFGRALMLRDTEGVTAAVAVIPAPLVPIVARFDGRSTLEQIADEVARETGQPVLLELVRNLATDLEEALFLDSPRYRAERREVEERFARAPLRPASHAGGAYHADPVELRHYLDEQCLARARLAREANGASAAGRSRTTSAGGENDGTARDPVRALVSPHIDPWRGAECYGHAYDALAHGLSAEVDRFVLLGTSHAPMRQPFALCRKAFDTPFGPLEADLAAIDAIAEACPFDAYDDAFNHKREHSIEFQAVFVRHLVGAKPVQIIPVLCGIGDSARTGRDPAKDERVEAFVRALREVCRRRGEERVVIIAGADLAHVGPRFGDSSPYDASERRVLERTDRESLEHATRGDGAAFFAHVQGDLDKRRVCGLGPIYTLLRVLPKGVRGDVLHYEQTVDPEEGSIVSHAAAVFH